jgi:two-component system, OmpR family, response regulator QseB
VPRILIIEDESRIAAFVEKGLLAQQFSVVIGRDVNEAIELAQQDDLDLILLDLGLPGGDGLSVLETLRGQGIATPIIILTARHEIDDKLAGLEGGADDYMTKPFRFEELLARIRLRMKAKSPTNGPNQLILAAGNVLLDLRTRKATINNQEIDLPG